VVEEYVRMGFSDEQLMGLFRSSFFAGTHALYHARGDEWVRQLIERVREQWGQPRFTIRRENDGQAT
jgi:hypothetical protein